MQTIIIIGVILMYSGYVIFKKIKDVRNGKFCSCGCDGCSASKGCKSKK
ncbi:FeoB-associated Cys-rich membrane protein [Anaeromicropila herbilytica]|uniref:FeoB-associated Cys-rich membrane protein n=1 Tax=Anaeromicropila herbilytica TaxID=2785025 RepID=A0A7R7ENS3_9FIRM|nr:FeoB-associated Cys-rich membrane protein [Anaeromicropila herbilytica]BCN32244.1 hypothetical protein bsdtb5_35390 [Anaeromicropila herbilytica]